jgi:glycosyltransferase involved in cell wall biosynthesis
MVSNHFKFMNNFISPYSDSSTVNLNLSQKEKILVVSRTFYPKEGGIEEYVYNRCLQDPEQVIVLSAGLSGDRAFDEAQAFPVYRWWVPQWLYGVGVKALIRQVLYIVSSIIYSLKLYRQYRYRSIEWGHGYDFPALLILTYLLPIPCVMYLHGNDLLCPLKNPFYKLLFQWTLNRVDYVICNSSYTQDCLISQFYCDQKTTVINPSIRPDKFGPAVHLNNQIKLRKTIRQYYQIPENAIVLLSVGRLVKRKGFDRVISHLPFLLENNVNVHYLICGRGPMETELRSQTDSLGLSDRVHFVGYVPDSELGSYYSASDLFILLTFFSQSEASIEGFGIVYLEAAYFGKPILATRVGGVVDAVRDGENGILMDTDAPEQDLEETLLKLCQNRGLREQLGRNGQKASRNYVPHRSMYQTQILNPS